MLPSYGGSHSSRASPDMLVDLARDFPKEVVSFLQISLWQGVFFSFVPICCAAYLASGSIVACCNRPLEPWIYVNSVFSLLQLPLKAIFLRHVHKFKWQDSDVSEFMGTLTSSLPWKVNKVLSVVVYGWQILGIVWIVNASSCELSYICKVNAGGAMLKMLLSWICFQYQFSRQQEEPAEAMEETEQQGASRELIDSIQIIEYSADVLSDGRPETACAVCLSEFDNGQLLRRLPCGHHFHQHCIDKWLARSKVCPLCKQNIECNPSCGGERSTNEKKQV